jgi:hypothetical protein
MGDADDSYDFLEVKHFLARLREGYDFVQGCRLFCGGGWVLPGAMFFFYYWLGNFFFSAIARSWFGFLVRDIYCGLRGFRREFQASLGQRCTGMEFATEMVLRSALAGGRIAEVPITLHPDGRRMHPSHLRTLRDGWRTLRLLLLYNPRWLFLVPRLTLVALGLLAFGLALPKMRIDPAHLDAHTLLFGSLGLIVGFQSVLFFLATKTFAIGENLLPRDPALRRVLEIVQLEKGLVLGGVPSSPARRFCWRP